MRSKVGTRDLENDSVVYVLDPHWLVELIDELPAAKKRREIWDKKPKTGQIDEDDRDGEYEHIRLPGGRRTSMKTHCLSNPSCSTRNR